MSCFFKGKWIQIIGLLTAGLLLSGCTGLKLAYNQGEHLAVWWLNGYVDLDKVQAQQVRTDLRALQQNHRQQTLPQYAQALRQAQALAADDVTAEQVCALKLTVRHYVDALRLNTEPMATTLALSLTPEQINRIERKYAKTNAEYRKEWLALTKTDMQKKRYDKALERAEMVYGSMDTVQKDLIRQQLGQSSFDPQQVEAERLRRQADTLKTLRQLPRSPEAMADARLAVHGLMDRYVHSPQTAYRAYADVLEQQDCQSIANVHNSTSPKQRTTAIHWLAEYEQSLRELAAQR